VLQSEYGLLVEIGADQNVLRVSSPDYEGSDEPDPIPCGSRSLTGYTAFAGKVVVVDDATRDRRLDLPARATELGFRSAIAAPVFGPSGVCAVVMAVSTQPYKFSQSSAHFLQSIANVVGIVLRPS
jgi:GAF domain-containing protein